MAAVAPILMFHNADAVILEPDSWILAPATGRRLRIPSAKSFAGQIFRRANLSPGKSFAGQIFRRANVPPGKCPAGRMAAAGRGVQPWGCGPWFCGPWFCDRG
jgi:hypothetical protein